MFKSNFFQALSVFAGTIIGVGLFSLPYIAVQSGFRTLFFYFLLLGAVVIIINLMYGEVALRTKRKKRLPGYAKKYLGGKWQKLALVSGGFGFYGAILAYLIVGGEFLTFLCQPLFGGSRFIYTLIYFIAGALLIYWGIEGIAKTEFCCLILFFAILFLIFYQGYPLIEMNNFFNFSLSKFFLPYGPVLFSLAGIALVPEIKEMLNQEPEKLKKVIYLGIILAAVTYLFFTFLIVGLTGKNTSLEAISGLEGVISGKLVGLAFIFGVLTTFTSFITLGLTLKKIFWYDLRLKKNLSWFLTCFIPLFLFLLGVKDFITVIGLTGGAFLGVDVIIIILSYLKAKTKGDLIPVYDLKLPRFIIYSLILFFFLGAIYQIVYFI